MVPNIVWQECMTPFNVVWQTPEPNEVRDDYSTKSVGYRSKRSKEHPYYTLLPVGQSVRWWSGQWSGYMGYNTNHPYILPLITFTCLLFGGVSIYYYICIHIIGIGDDNNNPLVVEDIKH